MMSNKIKVDNFCNELNAWRIKFVLCNPYHVQIQKEHNFYPTNRKYYNSETEYKTTYPIFNNSNEVLEWLSKHTGESEDKALSARISVKHILEVLNEVKSLEEAKNRFLNL